MQNNVLCHLDLNFKLNRRWFDDNYYVAIYDNNDNYITCFEKLDDMSKFFKQDLKKILYAIRRDNSLELDGHRVKLFIYKKENEKRVVSRK